MDEDETVAIIKKHQREHPQDEMGEPTAQKQKFDISTLVVIFAFVGVLFSVAAITFKRFPDMGITKTFANIKLTANAMFFTGLVFAIPAIVYIIYYIIQLLITKAPAAADDDVQEEAETERPLRLETDVIKDELTAADKTDKPSGIDGEIEAKVAREAMNARIREVKKELDQDEEDRKKKLNNGFDLADDIYAGEDKFAREVPLDAPFYAVGTMPDEDGTPEPNATAKLNVAAIFEQIQPEHAATEPKTQPEHISVQSHTDAPHHAHTTEHSNHEFMTTQEPETTPEITLQRTTTADIRTYTDSRTTNATPEPSTTQIPAAVATRTQPERTPATNAATELNAATRTHPDTPQISHTPAQSHHTQIHTYTPTQKKDEDGEEIMPKHPTAEHVPHTATERIYTLAPEHATTTAHTPAQSHHTPTAEHVPHTVTESRPEHTTTAAHTPTQITPPPPRQETTDQIAKPADRKQKIDDKKMLFAPSNLDRYLRNYFVETASCFLMDRDKYIDYFGIAPYNKITIKPSKIPGVPDEVIYSITTTKPRFYKFCTYLIDMERFITHEQLYHNFILSIESGKSLVRISEQLHKLYRKLYKSDFVNNFSHKEDFDNLIVLVSNNYILGNNNFRNIFTRIPFDIPDGLTENNIVNYLANPNIREKFVEAFPNYSDIGFESLWDALYICFINSIKNKLSHEQITSAITTDHKRIAKALAREDKKLSKKKIA
ncbi:MAG: hypothetical protein LBQ05_02140 [Christensenellaceae bacterium]|jgi:hypothetical protein|nr:hypothetical protein [Christensenellaceae bacterium]